MRTDLENISEEWSNALREKNVALALETAMKGYLLAKGSGERVDSLMFLGFIRQSASQLFDEASSNENRDLESSAICSFCLTKQTRMVRGVNVAICNNCIDLAKSAL